MCSPGRFESLCLGQRPPILVVVVVGGGAVVDFVLLLVGGCFAGGGIVAAASCPEFAAFRHKLDVHSATLIFASAYANNPASMFGHVVLRLNHRARPHGQQPKPFTEADATPQLLDNSVAFLAQVGTDDDP